MTETDSCSRVEPSGPAAAGISFDGSWLIEVEPVPEELAGLSEIRDAVRAALSEPPVSTLADDVVLVASELVANALRHGCAPPSGGTLPGDAPGALHQPHPDDERPVTGRVRLGVRRTRRDITLFVCDPSPVAPVRRGSDVHRVTGRGLDLVAALSTAWGWVPGRLIGRRRGQHPGGSREAPGKTVWASFAIRPTSP